MTRSGALLLRLSAEERQELQRQATAEGRSLADLIRVRCGLPAARQARAVPGDGPADHAAEPAQGAGPMDYTGTYTRNALRALRAREGGEGHKMILIAINYCLGRDGGEAVELAADGSVLAVFTRADLAERAFRIDGGAVATWAELEEANEPETMDEIARLGVGESTTLGQCDQIERLS